MDLQEDYFRNERVKTLRGGVGVMVECELAKSVMDRSENFICGSGALWISGDYHFCL